MAKEIYLYSSIYDFTAKEFIQSIEENKSDEIVARINTSGGSVFSFWGMAAKMQEHGNITAKVDGGAFSSGANLLLYAKRVIALDVTSFMFHRADMVIESEEDREFLNRVNDDLKAKMLKRVNTEKLKELKGITVDELYDPNSRIDLFLTAREMEKLGLVDEVVEIDPKEASAFSKMFEMAAKYKSESENKNTNNTTNKNMNINELKSSHPELYNKVVAIGVANERERVGAWMEFSEIDAKAVREGINEGKELGQKAVAEFARKAISAEALKNLEASSSEKVETTEEKVVEADKSTEEKEAVAFWDKVNAEAKQLINKY